MPPDLTIIDASISVGEGITTGTDDSVPDPEHMLLEQIKRANAQLKEIQEDQY